MVPDTKTQGKDYVSNTARCHPLSLPTFPCFFTLFQGIKFLTSFYVFFYNFLVSHINGSQVKLDDKVYKFDF